MQAIPKYRQPTLVVMLVALLFAARPACAAAAGGDPAKPPQLFATDATLALTLTAPWRDFIRNKNAKTRYPGTLDYVDEAGAKHSLPMAFATRGHNRLSVCKFPPTKLMFEKDASAATPFHGNKSLKLVRPCDSDERSEQYVVKEMLAYHIYNLITPRSFKVRPLAVTYVDSAGRASDGPHFGYLVEDDSELAKRNHLQKLEVPTLDLAQLELQEASRFALFEYLIGNTDFAVLNGSTSARCCHNAVLLAESLQSKVFAVPYDFDSSGLVDAHYAVPSPVLNIRSNRTRVYRGFCTANPTLEAARREILGLEPQIRELVRTEKRLSAGTSQTADDYLAKGFEVLRDDEKFAREITAKCRK